MRADVLLKVDSNIEITNITNNSREVEQAGLYFALEGLTVDGHDYIDDAIANGALAIVHSKQVTNKQEGILYYQVENMNEAYNQISARFYDNPQSKLKIIGATGTNGKSSTTWILDDLLNAKYRSGYIGTIGIKSGSKLMPSPFTTLLPHQYCSIFANMLEDKTQFATIEVSSQGLDQHRVDFIDFDYAIMTNLTHDHLDYHKTMDNYLKAKAILFENLKPDGKAIINNDDQSSVYLKQVTSGQICTYGIENESDVRATNVKLYDTYTEFTLNYGQKQYPIKSNLVGKFNVYNLLAALAIALDLNIDIKTIQRTCQQLSQVAGRMERVENDWGLNIIVDYAHTPDGFSQVFDYVKTITNGNIISVFGAAGERDFVKRPTLGAIADEVSNYIVLTEEDCLGEDPHKIAQEIATGIKQTEYEYIANRSEAIKKALDRAKPGDSVVLLAKGQEKFLKRKNEKAPYIGDMEVCYEYLEQNK